MWERMESRWVQRPLGRKKKGGGWTWTFGSKEGTAHGAALGLGRPPGRGGEKSSVGRPDFRDCNLRGVA